ncbi:hypothetical protein SPRG_09643 [Saprolegnia parasitica CBS 223.65]|uniref:RRM Nup35-type domain-containing protein n=1 Tax=Saprolegnia parasitica (strain CBS 223.65) TaxID=695850 RepID=A0A067C6N0_SAPPC|nr:hypothetical protein SPRG_09643 [Saprolegnia parasitica CBS 223.65]KDO24810.1 hypothetical protein SPRG_09643 [Saprolegnia parasitica CBS 223.65]|eukprot:XP_012204458.1 hypothetical protein SPRG_09643 [Saprolegnia parasitica CBS 223.65]
MSGPSQDADIMPSFFLDPSGHLVHDKASEEDTTSPVKSTHAYMPLQNYQTPWEGNGLDHQYQSLRRRNGAAATEPTSTSIPTASLFGSLSARLDQARPVDKATVATTQSAFSFPSLKAQEWGVDEQYWITVFGFSAVDMEAILKHFQSMGDAVQYRYGRGNWLYVRYRTRLQAEKALGESGSTLGGTVMIGVKRCLVSEMDADTPAHQGSTSSTAPSPLLSRELQVAPSDDDFMEPPRRQTNFCSRLLRFLFNV